MRVSVLLPLYLLSSFFGQCGPNCTTFLVPAEIFPTEIRTASHGLSAAAGKVGALTAAVVFPKIVGQGGGNGDQLLFLISGLCSFLGAIITWICIPDTTELDLYELDKEWRMIALNSSTATDDVNTIGGQKYVGPARYKEHLRLWERKWDTKRGINVEVEMNHFTQIV